MNAVERLEAAIAKLERYRSSIPIPPLMRWRDQERIPGWDGFIVVGDSAEDGDDCNPFARVYTEEYAEQIVTLHRTIDAQLAILRDSFLIASSLPASVAFPSTYTPDIRALALADAILGGVS